MSRVSIRWTETIVQRTVIEVDDESIVDGELDDELDLDSILADADSLEFGVTERTILEYEVLG